MAVGRNIVFAFVAAQVRQLVGGSRHARWLYAAQTGGLRAKTPAGATPQVTMGRESHPRRNPGGAEGH